MISKLRKFQSDKDQTKRLQLKERGDTGVQVKDLLSFVVKSVSEIEHVMNVGNQNRSVRATNMNDHSSRSHAIFTIYIECSNQARKIKNFKSLIFFRTQLEMITFALDG